jgi:hypothetical protein
MAESEIRQTFIDWDGVRLFWDSNNKNLCWRIQDAREAITGSSTEYLNSVAATANTLKNYVNLYDTNVHYIGFCWNKDSLQKGAVLIDKIVSYGTTEGNGKSTPLNFIWNDTGQTTKIVLGGYFPDRASSTATTNFYTPTQCFNGLLYSITIWDQSLTIVEGNPYDTNTFELGSCNMYNAMNGSHPLTGSEIKALSSNVIAHYDFTKQIVGSLTAKDEAGSTVSGAQTAPTTGHTLSIYGLPLSSDLKYVLYDSNVANPSISFPNGLIQFLDHTGIIRTVGTIFYDFGVIILDNEYVLGSGSGVPFISTAATTGMGFDILTVTSIPVLNVAFDSAFDVKRSTLNTTVESEYCNYTQNPTGLISSDGSQLLKNNQGTYVSGVGFYNSLDELIAVAKLSKPVRKDEDHTIKFNISLDF